MQQNIEKSNEINYFQKKQYITELVNKYPEAVATITDLKKTITEYIELKSRNINDNSEKIQQIEYLLESYLHILSKNKTTLIMVQSHINKIKILSNKRKLQEICNKIIFTSSLNNENLSKSRELTDNLHNQASKIIIESLQDEISEKLGNSQFEKYNNEPLYKNDPDFFELRDLNQEKYLDWLESIQSNITDDNDTPDNNENKKTLEDNINEEKEQKKY